MGDAVRTLQPLTHNFDWLNLQVTRMQRTKKLETQGVGGVAATGVLQLLPLLIGGMDCCERGGCLCLCVCCVTKTLRSVCVRAFVFFKWSAAKG